MRNTAIHLAAICLAAGGCMQADVAYEPPPAAVTAPPAAAARRPAAPPPAAKRRAEPQASPSPLEGRKLVYRADFTIVVPDISPAMDSALAMAIQMGGYLNRQSGPTIVVRIPAERFHEAVNRLRELGKVSGNIAADDVTERYLDLETRLANAKALAGRLRALLEKTDNLNDALTLERELARVQTDIDRLGGQLRLLTNQTAFATISITFCLEDRRVEPPPAMMRAKLPFAWLGEMGLDRLMRFSSRTIY